MDIDSTALILAFIAVIVIASILIIRRDAGRITSLGVTTTRQHEERYTTLSLAHASVSARVYQLELEYNRLKAEFDTRKAEWERKEAEWERKEAEWSAERRYMQASINSLARRVVSAEGMEVPNSLFQEQDIISRGVAARGFLMSRFNVNELHLLVTDLNGDWGDIANSAKIDDNSKTVTAALAQETIEWFSRRDRLAQLESEMRKRRPAQNPQ